MSERSRAARRLRCTRHRSLSLRRYECPSPPSACFAGGVAAVRVGSIWSARSSLPSRRSAVGGDVLLGEAEVGQHLRRRDRRRRRCRCRPWRRGRRCSAPADRRARPRPRARGVPAGPSTLLAGTRRPARSNSSQLGRLTTRALTPCSASVCRGQRRQLHLRAGADQDDVGFAVGVDQDVAALATSPLRAGAVEDRQILAGEDQRGRAARRSAPPARPRPSRWRRPGG